MYGPQSWELISMAGRSFDHLYCIVAELRHGCEGPHFVDWSIQPANHMLAPLCFNTSISDLFLVCILPTLSNQMPWIRIENVHLVLQEVDNINWEVSLPKNWQHNLHININKKGATLPNPVHANSIRNAYSHCILKNLECKKKHVNTWCI